MTFQPKAFAPLCLLMVFCGCSSGSKQRLVIYSPHGKEMLTEFEHQYEQAHPGVDVQWLDMGSQDAYDRVRTERENPQADIWWGAPATTFAKAEAESLLERYVPTWDEAVKPEFKSRNGCWYGTFLTPEVIMYNNRALTSQDAPKDWDELLDVRWRGKIIIRYPLASGTMRIIYSAIIQREAGRTGSVESGFDWLRRLDANTKGYAADPTQLYLKIAREEGLVTLWNLPDAILQSRMNGYPFGYVVPRSGTPLIVDCIAIVKGTSRRAEAERFYEFVTSKGALIRQAKDYGRIPARSDLSPSELPDWLAQLDLKAMNVDWQELEANEKVWMKRWDEEVKGKGKDRLSIVN
ncbi:MAG TPA: iron ABC transporter substrate-binding protein [Bacteroidetes bacterium]|jgi:iron(III) transport system substrate-binding protein|nr:iron ABC transporter substrate-binding protein [Bacteroidota bacterium]